MDWFVLSSYIQFTFWRGATDQSILPNISGFFERVCDVICSILLTSSFLSTHAQRDTEAYRAYTDAAIAMGDSIRLAECFNTTVRDAYELPKKDAVLVMWRDFDESRSVSNMQ